MRPAVLAAVAVLVLAGLLFGLISLDDLEDLFTGSSGGSMQTGTAQTASPEEALAALEDLTVAEAGSMSGYSREAFPHWSDAGEFGWEVPSEACDARDAALIRDGEDVAVGEGCSVTGLWRDPYSGVTNTDASDVDIDHLVPLANAWRSGADEWSEEKRERFANAPENLLAADAGENRSKGDRGPEAWRPPDEGAWCDYAVRWTLVKRDYALSVTSEERTSLREMLDTCEAA
ncbi:Protein of unknown function (DUF1524) [Rubrobacter radiotolerans]|uniref:HNH endonuclease family protein n=1 Tax=Rubrobacter radiotolerans TaxID=42256 RepID=A0A023X399_RUBRA|nr:HNH endonuclease family protein [Rubrobacter radiotolerans]AHY46651.1 Protein of unknown function (DUF1524) [Rubrobacter radiotolerans]MDX5894058.1 HNH endonuclease family protein [Rubrobacter radiotolerans]SMC05084.1 Protein of unknown function [Rubrobacter radiotolerans DSM 5868]